MEMVWPALLVGAAVGSGLNGGLFFAFSTFVMQALDRLPAREAVAAMQAINLTVLNPLFFLAFFGTAALALVLIAAALFGHAGGSAGLVVAGGLIYLVGVILVTMVGNVPLNDRLAALPPRADAEAGWARYRTAWMRWNHVRTASGLGAAAAFAAAGLGA